MEPAAPRPRIQIHARAPEGWDDLLARCPDPEFTAGAAWHEMAARHYLRASSLFLTAELEGTLVGGLPVLARTRHGLARLESSLEGTLAGPQVAADLPAADRRDVSAALCRALAERVGGRTLVAAMTLAAGPAERLITDLADGRWRGEQFASAVVDCRGGLEHIGRDRWTNNRRNERNRGLKRGCTLHAERDPEAVAGWYPLYAAKSREWAQTPVPLAFFQELLALPGQRCVLNTVRYGGEVIAGHFCFRSRGRLVAWQGAVRPEVQGTLFPTTLVYWQDLSLACEQDLAGVDFGGSVGRDSLWDFKRRCGAEAEPRCQLTVRSALGRLLRRAADRLRGRSR